MTVAAFAAAVVILYRRLPPFPAGGDPGAYVWLYLMLFSTLVPTLLHACLSLLGVQGLWPRRLRRRAAGWVEAAPRSPLHAVGASLGLGLIWALPVLLLGVVLWAAWHVAGPGVVAFLGALPRRAGMGRRRCRRRALTSPAAHGAMTGGTCTDAIPT